ncbi:MAG: hypothetical protein FWE38_03065 [Firmicutes bacterium]|nr:hypothetical protein [Bacillota bacterium]
MRETKFRHVAPRRMIILTAVTLGIYYIAWHTRTQHVIQRRTGVGLTRNRHLLATMFTFGGYIVFWHIMLPIRLRAFGIEIDMKKFGLIQNIMTVVGYSVLVVGLTLVFDGMFLQIVSYAVFSFANFMTLSIAGIILSVIGAGILISRITFAIKIQREINNLVK